MRYNKDFTEELLGHKNRDYGAYRLRIAGDKILLIAFSITVLFYLAVVIYPLALQYFTKEDEDSMLKQQEKRILDYAKLQAPPPIELDKPKDEPKPLPKEPPKIATVKYVKPTVKPDEEVPDDELSPTIDEMKDKQIGVENIEGDSLDASSFADYDSYDGVEEGFEEEAFVYVSQMPEYPGGQEAVLAYLAENIKYPSMARENRVQGLVIVSFIIGVQGDVRDVKVVRGIGAGCDEEAVRVVESMPSWIPGKQGDRVVPVLYNLPIRFVLK